jgi:hypothetical protein
MPQYFRLVKETSLWKFAAQDPMLDYSVRMLDKSAALALFRLWAGHIMDNSSAES